MIAIGCDHGGYELKLEIIKYLEEKGLEYKDFGCDGESVDYPIYAQKVGQAIIDGECEKGILICGTGIGISNRSKQNERDPLCALFRLLFSRGDKITQ